MKLECLAALGLLLGASATSPPRAQEPAATAPADAFAEELKALQRELQTARSEWQKSLPTDDSGRRRVDEASLAREPSKDFVPKFRELAARAKGTASGVGALQWIIRIDPTRPGPDGPAADAPAVVAFEELTRDYLESPALESFARELQYAGMQVGAERAEKAMREILAKSPHRAVQAAAALSLASALMDRARQAKTPEAGAAARGEAVRLFEQLRDRYADTSSAADAAGWLYELEHLQIGMPAPDFESVDQDGVKFKLSDYRGKVVVVDFWGEW